MTLGQPASLSSSVCRSTYMSALSPFVVKTTSIWATRIRRHTGKEGGVEGWWERGRKGEESQHVQSGNSTCHAGLHANGN